MYLGRQKINATWEGSYILSRNGSKYISDTYTLYLSKMSRNEFGCPKGDTTLYKF